MTFPILVHAQYALTIKRSDFSSTIPHQSVDECEWPKEGQVLEITLKENAINYDHVLCLFNRYFIYVATVIAC